jgi:phage-related protein (TIGR01555 family)
MASWAQKLLKLGNDAQAQFRTRMDGWANALTGLATNRDKTTYTVPFLPNPLTPIELEGMYHGDDIAARIVSAVPDEAFREGFTVISKAAQAEVNEFLDRNPSAKFDDLRTIARAAMKKESATVQQQANELQKACDTHGLVQKAREAMTWGRLYGLGAILIGADDGREPWEPLDREAVRSIDYMTVLDKRDLTPWRWYADVQAPKFSDVAIYLLQPVGVYVGAPYDVFNTAQVLLVHESRMIRFGGELTSKRLRLGNQGTDYSVLQKCYRALQLVNDNWQSAAALLSDASQAVFKIRGLIQMIAANSDDMITRFQFMDLVRSTFRAILLDAGDQTGDAETFERVATPFEGIPQMLDATWTRASAAARMPKQILLGEPPGGLNAGGTADANVRWWYDTVRATQNQSIKPQIEYYLYLEATARNYPNPTDWSVLFPPLWQLTAKEEAEMHAAQSNADKNYADMGWLTPEEGALSRFGGGKFSLETKIDTATRKRTMATTLAAMEQEAANDLGRAQDPAPTPGLAAEAEAQTAQQPPEPIPPITNQS